MYKQMSVCRTMAAVGRIRQLTLQLAGYPKLLYINFNLLTANCSIKLIMN